MKDKKFIIVVVLICVLIVSVLGATVAILNGQRQQAELAAPAAEAAQVRGVVQDKRNVVVTPENVEELIDTLDAAEFTEPGYYTCQMTTNWHFTSADAVSYDARVDNRLDNTNDVYFDVFLASDESEPIYQSPVIPIGSFLQDIQLDKPLDVGAHSCVMVYHLVDEEQNTLSQLRVGFTITIEG